MFTSSIAHVSYGRYIVKMFAYINIKTQGFGGHQEMKRWGVSGGTGIL